MIEVFEAMTEWGGDKEDRLECEQGLLKIQKYYALLFKDRFYFVSLYRTRG